MKNDQNKLTMDLPNEILIFLFLPPYDMVEISATCKLFYHLSRKNKLLVKKFNDFKKLFNDRWQLHDFFLICFFVFSK